MTTAELREATKEFDRPIPESRFKPLTKALRAELARARRKAVAGRPRVGKGAKRVLVTIEQGLLERADAHARKQGISRAQLIAQGLQAVLPKAG